MLASLGYAAAYTGVGLVLLLLGFLVLDLLTPGKLAQQIWEQRSVNASIVLGAGLLGVGAVAFTTIWTNATSGFGSALAWTVVFGVAGILLQALVFVLLDLLTPGKLGETVCEVRFHPATIVTAALQLSVSAIVVASIA